jgi:hypothetical protein
LTNTPAWETLRLSGLTSRQTRLIPYVAISVALATIAHENRREILFRWGGLTCGLCIVAGAGTHFMEVVTIWIPVYIVFAGVKTSRYLRGVSNERIHPAVNG